MEENEKLREQAKDFKTRTDLPYSFLAKQMGMKKQSFYNFISGAKGLSQEKQSLLKETLRRFE